VIAESPILSVRGLRVEYRMGPNPVEVLHGVDLDIAPGETVGVVGESGSGKSTLALAIMRHLAQNGRVSAGQILFRGEDLLTRTAAELRSLRGRRLAMVYQDPQTSLNPSLCIGEQIAEILRTHEHLGNADARQRSLEMLERVHLPRPRELARRYPHQLSGGQRQRVIIAMALVCNPTLLIMDEPTTALDVTTEARILDLVEELKRDFDSSILYISHNMGVIARVADRVAVMYAGQIVEEGEVHRIFAASRHPYTVGLRASLPRLDIGKFDGALQEIPGLIPAPTHLPSGCLFQPRCSYARPECGDGRPPMLSVEPDHIVRCLFWKEVDPLPRTAPPEVIPTVSAGQQDELLTVEQLTKYYESGSRLLFLGTRHAVHAVDGVSLTLAQGETLAIVGESGSGKTSLARTIVGLQEPSSGRLAFERQELAGRVEKRPSALLRALQMVFQNPDSSLNPRHTILEIVGRPLQRFKRVRGAQLRAEVAALLRAVNLSDTHLDRFPEQLSGGEKQRIAILRAFAGEPRAVLCDEPVSALDVSVQAAVLNLLLDLQRRHRAAYMLISHDLAVVRYLADRVAVMYAGQIVEHGTVGQVFAPPYHPYTEALLSAIPIPDPSAAHPTIRLEGAPAFDVSVPGCRFAARCPRKLGSICETTPPPIIEAALGHTIACHIPLDELRNMTPIAPTHADDVALATHAPA
jgi:peptide/nickel transport system ATP-binding protein